MNPRIEEILDIKPFTIKVKWTNGQVRSIDFNEFLSEEKRKGSSNLSKLFIKDIFFKVKTDGRTLYWENLTEMLDEKDNLIPAPLDFCPDVLYQASKEN
jgi:Protein of unknown function (DUF2442)